MTGKNDEMIKKRILAESVRLFSDKGFHGTTIREIAASANCSLPMLYYYYKNKEELFYEVAYKELTAMTERLNAKVQIGETIQEIYFNAMRQRKELSSYDKAVYKLSLMVWLGFDGDSKARRDIIEWENGRVERTEKILDRYIENKEMLPVFAKLLTRVLENMTEKIILLNEDIPDEQIKTEIDYLIKIFI